MGNRLEFRICATCKNLEIQEQGREFAAIADTEYAVFHCKVLGWTSREDYLMAPVPTNLPPSDPFDCPHWEEFRPEQGSGVRGRGSGDVTTDEG